MLKKILSKAEKISEQVNCIIARSTGGVIIVIILLIVVDVIGRFAFNSPLPGTTEITSVLLAYIAFMSYAYGLIHKSYVRVEVFFLRFPAKIQFLVELIMGLAGALVFYIFFRGGWSMFIQSFLENEQMPASVAFPYWLAKIFVPLGSLLMLIQCILHSLRQLTNLFPTKEVSDGE